MIKESKYRVLLWWPNLIGYFRILLWILSVVVMQTYKIHTVTYGLLWMSFGLDAVDGWIARKLDQTSSFGAFIDVLIDNLVRGSIWVWALPQGPFSVIPSMWEMTVFLATHKGGGAAWKTGYFCNAPKWVQSVLSNEFRQFWGIWATIGLFGAPLWFWSLRYLPSSILSSVWIGAFFVTGRLIAFSVEVWVLFRHFKALIEDDFK
eukprot:TRINITY_DN12340_c0_g1_i4.p1 TRINITY_DN12340_c0_g1~~TRINITY_DN12340_c0_g1_i4.p1  ORF type:complete len:205 (+),score=21.52 TRINITY_DN12340_c0_g1_i4:219-833(+)